MADGSQVKVLSKNAERNQYRTPKLFKIAAKILESIEKRHDSFKNCVFSAKHPNKPALTAIICQVLQRRAALDHVIAATKMNEETNLDPYLLRVVINEQLFRERELTGLSKTVLTTRNNRDALKKALAEYQSRMGTDEKNWSNLIPRYARVNVLITTLKEVELSLESDGLEKVSYDPDISYQDYLQLIKNLKVDQYLIDLHVENLLVFHAKTAFFNHPLYTSAKLLLQDKASCFPSMLLNPKKDSVVLDACAAPGMKTTHLAAIMNNTGKILAIDKDEKRAVALQEIVTAANAVNVTVTVQDFLKVDSSKSPYKEVKYILVDPSCSGSGIVKRSATGEEEVVDDKRLGSLATFQAKMLLKALHFPNVHRVVYSTCSIHKWENEEVVDRALKKVSERFQLTSVNEQYGFPFLCNAIDDFPFVRYRCIRLRPDDDLTNGFFVAVFERFVDARGIRFEAGKLDYAVEETEESFEKEKPMQSRKRRFKKGKEANADDGVVKEVIDEVTGKNIYGRPLPTASSSKAKQRRKHRPKKNRKPVKSDNAEAEEKTGQEEKPPKALESKRAKRRQKKKPRIISTPADADEATAEIDVETKSPKNMEKTGQKATKVGEQSEDPEGKKISKQVEPNEAKCNGSFVDTVIKVERKETEAAESTPAKKRKSGSFEGTKSDIAKSDGATESPFKLEKESPAKITPKKNKRALSSGGDAEMSPLPTKEFSPAKDASVKKKRALCSGADKSDKAESDAVVEDIQKLDQETSPKKEAAKVTQEETVQTRSSEDSAENSNSPAKKMKSAEGKPTPKKKKPTRLSEVAPKREAGTARGAVVDDIRKLDQETSPKKEAAEVTPEKTVQTRSSEDSAENSNSPAKKKKSAERKPTPKKKKPTRLSEVAPKREAGTARGLRTRKSMV